jgi:hypothetical protein
MAESITEGTLKQWNKAVGDFVEQDEEIATIETDKVGPSSGFDADCRSTYPSMRQCLEPSPNS